MLGKLTIQTLVLTVATLSAPLSAYAQAEETSSAPALVVELNALQPTDSGCRFTFVTTNNLAGELRNAAFEETRTETVFGS